VSNPARGLIFVNPNDRSSATGELTRRDFVGVGVAGGVIAVLPAAAQTGQGPGGTVSFSLTINNQQHEFDLDPRLTVLDLLREHLKLTGTKKGCDHGQCGACTVLLNGERRNACLMLAVMQSGKEITTVEGLAQGGQLHPAQQAFIENDGFQCGYCTPGQICSAVALIEEAKSGAPSVVTADLTRTGPIELTDAEIRERMSGNICRCGAYDGIVAAVRQAAQGSAEGTDSTRPNRRGARNLFGPQDQPAPVLRVSGSRA